MEHPLPHLARPRRDQLGVVATCALGAPPRRARPGGTRPRSRARRPRAAGVRMSSRSSSRSSKPASIAKSSSSAGSSLSLTSLTVTSKEAVPPGELGVAVVGGEASRDACASRPRRAPSSPSSKPGIRLPPPSSTSWSRPSPPANGSHCGASLGRASPWRARRASRRSRRPRSRRRRPARSAVSSRARRSRSASISCSICSSVDLRLAAGDLEAPVVAELGLGQHADLDRELERLALRRQLAEIELRVADGHDPGGLDRVGVPARERVAHGLLEHRLAPDALDHQRRGHLAAAEARELQLAPELARLALEAPLELAGGHLHLQAHARVAELGDGCLHGDGHARHDTVPPREHPALHRPRLAASARRGCGPARRPPGGRRARPAQALARHLLRATSRAPH